MKRILFVAVLILICFSAEAAFTADKTGCLPSGSGCTAESCCKKDACSCCSCCKTGDCKCCNEKCGENCADKKK